MNISKEEKAEIFKKYGSSETDTGSAEAQIALFTERINRLTDHLKGHKADNSTRLGLLRMVGKRRKLLAYLKKKDIEGYRSLITELKIRK
jgi:small subunit ribosomal protein S15